MGSLTPGYSLLSFSIGSIQLDQSHDIYSKPELTSGLEYCKAQVFVGRKTMTDRNSSLVTLWLESQQLEQR